MTEQQTAPVTVDVPATMPIVVAAPRPPAWEVCDDPRIRQVCSTCGLLADVGYAWGDPGAHAVDGDLFLCDDCTSGLLAAFAYKHGLAVVEAPDADDVAVQITFSPDDDPERTDVQITPEPLNAQQELAHLGMAIRRLGSYLSAYSAAMHAEAAPAEPPPPSGGLS